ncbi:MAG: 7-carboxy-7-deazaguanine synthase QueE [Bacteroidales bacterium]|nr:7-carboxy-7-deazaguanine synthase QueE [Bacteroidales bacterium]
MTIIRLSREGIFPITRDKDGNRLPTATGLSSPGTVQGEGKLCGVASLFIRLQGCNLRCRWSMPDGSVSPCDTAHTWTEGGFTMSVEDVMRTVEMNIGCMRHVVITGGEPLLQAHAVAQLLSSLRNRNLHSTVETNGLTDAVPPVLPDLLSISPKLSLSGLTTAQREASVRGTLLLARAALAEGRDVQLKFVVARLSDADEILSDYADSLRLLKPDDVIVMPLGASSALLSQTSKVAVELAVKNGWRFGPRLHIDLFGNKEAT